MRRHLLVTVSSDQAAMHGVRFVCDFLRDRRGLALTLFYTAPRPPAVWEHERNFESLAEYDRRAHDNREQGRAALDAGAALLREAGYAAGNVDAKLILREMSTAEDILRECEQGLYDAVVLGRRGQQGLEALVEQSVTRDLVERAFIAPLWVCRRFEKGRQGVLLCLDGSDASLRMADHVGFMLRAEPQHAITLFTVLGPGPWAPETPSNCSAEPWNPGRKRRGTGAGGNAHGQGHGSGPGHPGRGRPGALRRGGHGAHGRGRGLLRGWFMGSATQALLRELDGAALWIRT
jgi:nucleotide-binding universal stress UspA family protein